MSAYCYEYAVPLPYPGTPDVVFNALTDPSALEIWFAERVDIEIALGGAYLFWGKHTFDTPSKESASQKITHLEPARAFGFSWRFLGCDTVVTWLIEADRDAGSKVTIRHEFDQEPQGVRVKELIDDHWRLQSGNLLFYMMGERNIYRPDFDDDSPEVRQEIIIDAPPADVFAALIKPDLIKQWFPAPAPFVDPRVGGAYGFGFTFEKDGETVDAPAMTILEYEENKRLVTTWPDWRGDASVPDQTVAWTLVDLGGKTKLTLVHSGFIRAVDVSDYPFGWAEFLEKIGEVAHKQRNPHSN